ncbi:NEDD8-conjugating enzyme UBE2F-like [Clavelina lepadiformis]|uniref:NEDD8-conjugating enzyme UBE2F-like n=1 Tax=Clavelina lepadiformis TaxID=159417 RepID=UPI0040420A76
MITLKKKLQEAEAKKGNNSLGPQSSDRRATVRDKLLTKEIAEIGDHLNSNCQVDFENPDKIYEFTVIIKPDEGWWKGGVFRFSVFVSEDYNIQPPLVKCITRLWHPNISLDGNVCLSILRDHSLDGSGWAPTRSIKDVIWGLYSLFIDLVDFDDPLNIEAADEYKRNPKQFKQSVDTYLYRYAKQ